MGEHVATIPAHGCPGRIPKSPFFGRTTWVVVFFMMAGTASCDRKDADRPATPVNREQNHPLSEDVSDVGIPWGLDIIDTAAFSFDVGRLTQRWDSLEGFRDKVAADLAAWGDGTQRPSLEELVGTQCDESMQDLDRRLADDGLHSTLKNHFQSPLHRLYGKVVEFLTHGQISTMQAMTLNPTGGLVGSGDHQLIVPSALHELSLSFEQGNQSTVRALLTRHSVVHDALGFLYIHFNIGPGYSVHAPSDSWSGQMEGIVWSAVYGLDKDMAGLIDEIIRQA